MESIVSMLLCTTVLCICEGHMCIQLFDGFKVDIHVPLLVTGRSNRVSMQAGVFRGYIDCISPCHLSFHLVFQVTTCLCHHSKMTLELLCALDENTRTQTRWCIRLRPCTPFSMIGDRPRSSVVLLSCFLSYFYYWRFSSYYTNSYYY